MLKAQHKPGGAAALSGFCLAQHGTCPKRGASAGLPNTPHKPECSSSIGLTPSPAGRAPKARRISPLCLCTRGALMPRRARGLRTNRRHVNRNLHWRNAAALQRAPRPHIMVDGTEVPVRSSGRGAKPHRRYSPRARMRADPVSIRAAKASRRPIKGRRAGRAQPATPEPTVYRTGVR